MTTTIPDTTRAARDHRQAAWQLGVDWCVAQRIAKQALAALDTAAMADPYDRYLFLLGVANTLTALGREIAELDVRKGRVE